MNITAQVKRELAWGVLIIAIVAVGVFATELGIDVVVWTLKGLLALGQ